MSKYQAYPEYTKTELGWLTEIPKHWEIKKLKYLGEALIGLTYSPNDVIDENEGTLVLRSSNVQSGQLSFKDNVFVKKQIPEHLKVKSGDILICARNGSRALIGKNALITKDAEGMSFGAFMSVFRSPYNNYLSKVFNSALFEYQSGSFLTATINQLTTSNLNSFEIPLPPKNERNLITAFLDHETAKIDTLIEKQQQLIELLKEKRQAVISYAVTKGLNPDAPMKDSGVEWLGEVPEHWEISQAKYVFLFQRGHDLSSNQFIAGEIPVYGSNGIIGYHNQVTTKGPSITIGRSGSVGKINKVLSDFWAHNTSLYLKWQTQNSSIDYIYYLLLAMDIESLSSGSAVGTLDRNNIHKQLLALPPLAEQLRIVEFLNSEIKKFVILTQKSQSAINLMQERRAALISAAVTGKIDVRHWVAPTTSSDTNEAAKEVTA